MLFSQEIYHGKAVRLRKDEVLLPSGRRTTREVVEHPGSVGVVPLIQDGRILLIRQFRLPTGRVIWEIPAGTLVSGETPEQCARRELEEETGYRSRELELLFRSYLAPGYSMELMHFFVARVLEKGEQRPEEDEIIGIEPFPVAKVLEMIGSGSIMDTKTIAATSFLIATGRIAP